METMERLYTGKKFDEFDVGAVYKSPGRTILDAHIVAFAGLSGDFNPLHTDDEFCKNTAQGGRIAHGALTFTISAGLFNRYVDGTCIAFLGLKFDYLKMVRPGDTIHILATVKSKKPSSKGGRGVVVFEIQTINQTGEVVLSGEWTLLIEM